MSKSQLKSFLKPFLKTRESILTMDDLDEMEVEQFQTNCFWSIGPWWESPDEVADLFADYFSCEIA